jgi:ribulose 1,5-bisphosphate synthetase/thiazole synthase
MNTHIIEKKYDVVVVGGGSAGISSAIAAAKNGARTLLIESSPFVGGELLSGVPVDGCLNSRGEWIVGGIINELFNECEKHAGYIGSIFDWRSIWVVCLDPEILKFIIIKTLKQYNVDFLLYSFVDNIVVDKENTISGVFVVNKRGTTLYSASVFIDCTGDGDIAVRAGVPFEKGGEGGELQPVSMIFRLSGVESEPLLTFVKEHPENVPLGENPAIGRTREECAEELYKQGLPKVFLDGKGPLLSSAITSGELYPCSMMAITPVSLKKKEVSINSTRVANIDATDTEKLSSVLHTLYEQCFLGVKFLQRRVPGFENAQFSGFAPRIGIRETRRVKGESVLTQDDVMEGRKRDDGIAKGGHHIDIHGEGNKQIRIPVKNGGSYDIPYGCIVAHGINNLYIPGRHLSSTRKANGSARVMGTCMALGQAAGTAAAISASQGCVAGDVDVGKLRDMLREQGAVLDGTL